MRGCFVTGTDTGVGKTVLTAAIVARLRARGDAVTVLKPVITGLERVSRPGQRTYVDHAHIPRIQGGMGTAIISTSRGVMTGHDARREGVGGEVVARVW